MNLEEIRTLAMRGSVSPACGCRAIHNQIRAMVEEAMEVSGGSLFDYIDAHRQWSAATFGKENRTAGIIKHIAEELKETLDNSKDPYEWADIIILAIDGAVSNGIDADVLTGALLAKQAINLRRDWPEPVPGQPTFHLKEED
jgi:molybdopterin biosynthesis enzyme